MPLNTFRQIFLPYCVRRSSDGSYSVLNREYKDLGTIEQGAPDHYQLKGLGPKRLGEIAHGTLSNDSGQFWFLYDDGCLPDSSPAAWATYSERLRQLQNFEVKL